ncbi:MAG: hypothetical protein V3S69_03460 [Dehalococcoidales bacterium]
MDTEFFIYCDDDVVENNVLDDSVDEWMAMDEDERDYALDCINSLSYGDNINIAGHQLTCSRTHTPVSCTQLTVTIH